MLRELALAETRMARSDPNTMARLDVVPWSSAEWPRVPPSKDLA